MIPFTAGIHQGMRGSFVVLEFPDPADDDVAYVEDAAGGLVIKEDRDEIQSYREIFERLRGRSFGPKESLRQIGQLADDIH